jgi:hypothetical protein
VAQGEGPEFKHQYPKKEEEVLGPLTYFVDKRALCLTCSHPRHSTQGNLTQMTTST